MSSVHRDDWLTDENWKPRVVWYDGKYHWTQKQTKNDAGVEYNIELLQCRGGVYTDWMNTCHGQKVNCLLCIGHVD